MVLISLSAFFSASETALSSVNRMRLKSLAEDGNTRAKQALDHAEHFDQMLSTILVGNNVVNIFASSLSTVMATALWGTKGVAASTVVMTIVILIFGEITPKSFAKERSEEVALATAPALGVLKVVLTPVVWFFTQVQLLMGRLYASPTQRPSVTEEELMTIIETIEEEGVIDEQKSDLVQSALEFDDITAQEVLTPRVDLVAIDLADGLDQIREIVIASRFSRIPAYEGNIDNIVGILQTRELLEALLRGEAVDVRAMLTPPFFIHKTKPIAQLLADFKRRRIHIAVVTDDYGGTLGIVTMEDLLEELVGDIWDEDEEEKLPVLPLGEGRFEVMGDCDVEEMLEEIGYEDRGFSSEYSTVGGWALEQFEKIPKPGDSFCFDGIQVTVKALEDQRITKLLVEYHPAGPEQED